MVRVVIWKIDMKCCLTTVAQSLQTWLVIRKNSIRVVYGSVGQHREHEINVVKTKLWLHYRCEKLSVLETTLCKSHLHWKFVHDYKWRTNHFLFACGPDESQRFEPRKSTFLAVLFYALFCFQGSKDNVGTHSASGNSVSSQNLYSCFIF